MFDAEHPASRGIDEHDLGADIAGHDGVRGGTDDVCDAGIADPAPMFAHRMQLRVSASLQVEQVAHARLQDGAGVGLGDEVRRTEVERAHLVARVREPRHEGDRHVPECQLGLQGSADVEAVDPRHVRIEQDQIRNDAASQLQRLFAALGEGKVAHGRQRVAQDMDRRRVVIDDQDARRLRARRSGGGARCERIALQFLDHRLRTQVRPNPRGQLHGDEWLGDEIGRALAQRGHFQGRRVMARGKDDRNARQYGIRLHRLEHVEPGHARHVDVHQDEIRGRLARKPKSRFARGGKSLVGVLRQHPAHHLNRRRVVIDDQETYLMR